ncbi:MAG: hypothetical protein CBB68_11620 [Rhodospirillaceae bacterium TMED8]|nr:hypothetical protein [Magnetovibrio sp.]OUT49639.1 MAG: hypothetical protein CBB68_11620 [Rhodospirillaceae bacterium TMED8]|tara:strand:- start:26 stop:403 length:378 start_codon:yes stop_codon:yes gene_type:complete
MTKMGNKFFPLLSVGILLASMDAGAVSKRVKGQYGYSTQPYWKVGKLSARLSSACQRGVFGQREHMRLSIGFVGREGKAVTGIATSNWNLIDPYKLAKPNKTYHFFNQGFTNCKVYIAETPKNRR